MEYECIFWCLQQLLLPTFPLSSSIGWKTRKPDIKELNINLHSGDEFWCFKLRKRQKNQKSPQSQARPAAVTVEQCAHQPLIWSFRWVKFTLIREVKQRRTVQVNFLSSSRLTSSLSSSRRVSLHEACVLVATLASVNKRLGERRINHVVMNFEHHPPDAQLQIWVFSLT